MNTSFWLSANVTIVCELQLQCTHLLAHGTGHCIALWETVRYACSLTFSGLITRPAHCPEFPEISKNFEVCPECPEISVLSWNSYRCLEFLKVNFCSSASVDNCISPWKFASQGQGTAVSITSLCCYLLSRVHRHIRCFSKWTPSLPVLQYCNYCLT